MLRSGLALAALLFASNVFAQGRTVAKVTVGEVDVAVTRVRAKDGGLTLKLVAKGPWPKPRSLTLYEGGGDDDGAGDDDVRSIRAAPFELPGGKPGVRVDFTFRVPDGRRGDEQTDTSLVVLEGKVHKLLELRTRLSRDRSKTCRMSEVTTLELDAAGDLVAATQVKAEPALDEEDNPIDKTCKAPKGVTRKVYTMRGGKLVDADPTPADDDDDD